MDESQVHSKLTMDCLCLAVQTLTCVGTSLPSALSPITPGYRVYPGAPLGLGGCPLSTPIEWVRGLDAHPGLSGKHLEALPHVSVQSIGGTLSGHGSSLLPLPLGTHFSSHKSVL